jgi:hypothetical protein
MSDTDRYLPDTGDRQRVTFHVGYGCPGGFVGTISEDPEALGDPTVWVFYAEEKLIARGDRPAEGSWMVDVEDPEFLATHQLTPRQLQDLFERGSQAPNGPHGLFVAPTAPAGDRFRLDRGVLADSLQAEGDADEGCGLQHFGETPGEQIAGAVQHAELEQALHIPDGVDLDVLKLAPTANAVILTIRETFEAATAKHEKRRTAGLPRERQIASWRIEPGWLSDGGAPTFGDLCSTLEEVCNVANALLGSLKALLDGEQLLMELIAAPLTVLSYNSRARLASYRANVEDVTEGDADHARNVWPLLIETLEHGEAEEEWDGDRQRAFHLQPGGEPHLARQLVQLRNTLQAAGKLTPGELPDPTGGFESWTR